MSHFMIFGWICVTVVAIYGLSLVYVVLGKGEEREKRGEATEIILRVGGVVIVLAYVFLLLL